VATDTAQKVLYLLFPVPLKPTLRRTTLFVSCVNKTSPDLTDDELFTLADADGICAQAYQNQSKREIVLQQRTEWLNIIIVSQTLFCDWKRRHNQASSRGAPEKNRPCLRTGGKLSQIRGNRLSFKHYLKQTLDFW
jgi:hypothetical protein